MLCVTHKRYASTKALNALLYVCVMLCVSIRPTGTLGCAVERWPVNLGRGGMLWAICVVDVGCIVETTSVDVGYVRQDLKNACSMK